MSNAQAETSGERRRETRVNSSLSLVYQRVSAREIRIDPYDPRFELPQHFTLGDELSRIDASQFSQIEALERENPALAELFRTVNRKLDVLSQAIEGSLGHLISPLPQRVNLSQGGLSFHAAEPITPGIHLHLAISNPTHHYHIAAIGRVVFCEEEDLEGYRTGVAFVNIRPEDREILARDIIRKVRENQVVEGFTNPENG